MVPPACRRPSARSLFNVNDLSIQEDLASNKHRSGQNCSVGGATSAYAHGMDDGYLEEEIRKLTVTMTHQEVIQRFRKVFGRDMSPTERESFFLPETSPDDVQN